jgi:hypothetical protein
MHAFRITTVLALALAALVVVTSATAAREAKPSPQTGTWYGKVSQDIGLDEPHLSKVVFTAYKGRLVGLAARIKMECDDDSYTEALVSESWRVGKGPKLTQAGSFYAMADGVRFDGNLGRVLAEGTANARVGGCHGKGTWKAKRVDI